jgi:N-acetylmuramoyl-L-alanine amidase
MKKVLMMILVLFCVLACKSVFSASFTTQVTDGRLLIQEKSESGVTVLKAVDIQKINGADYLPLRKLAESFNSTVSWESETRSIKVQSSDKVVLFKSDSGNVYVNGSQISYSQPVIVRDGISYSPFDTYRIFTSSLGELSAGKPAEKVTDSINLVKGNSSDKITISGGSFSVIRHFTLVSPHRLVFDIKDFSVSTPDMAGSTFYRVRTSKNEDGSQRVVFDLNDKFSYTVNQEGRGISVIISKDGKFNEFQELLEVRNNSVIIKTVDYEGYSLSRLSNPFRIVIDIPKALVSSESLVDAGEGLVDYVKSYPYNDGTRIEIAMYKQCRFETEKNSSSLIIGIYEPLVPNILYYNSGDRKYIRIEGMALTDTLEAKELYYTLKTSNSGKTVAISFEDRNYRYKEGVVYVNDDHILQYSVKRNGTYVNLEITARNVYEYYVNSGSSYSNVNIIRKAAAGERIVVIDPGHGGIDPGAIVGKVNESELNLQISLKLKGELEAKGIRTYLLRSNDEFVGLHERADIANIMNASLFISIHCNTLVDVNFSGIMTLTFPGEPNYNLPNGKLFATIIHEETLKATGAKNAGIVDRDKLVVLRKTKMPAVLLESGFMTNSSELIKLLDTGYQQQLAVGIARAVERTIVLLQ